MAAAVAILTPIKAAATPTTFEVTAYGADPTGVRDSAKGIQQAIDAAETAGAGSIVHFPTGHYSLYLQIKGPNSLVVTGGVPITLRGDGAANSILTEQRGKNALDVQTDGTIIDSLQIDTQTNNDRVALVVAASNTLLENSTIRGGSNTFALFYPGPTGASRANLIYDTGNRVINVTINDLWNLDGFSFSYQQNGLIQNIDHTGSRLALFIDRNVEVDNDHYHPGTQPYGTQGFWITPPSDSVTVNGFVTDGNGGVLGANGTGWYSTNIAINNETLTHAGFHISVGEVRGLSIDSCNLGSNSTLRFTTMGQANGVVVKNCSSVPNVSFAQASGATVQAEFDNNTYPAFTPIPHEGSQTFLNVNASATDFTVKGGAFQNCSGGLFKGTNTTFAVSNLTGYPCTADSAPSAALAVTPSSGTPPLAVTADASQSTDVDATPVAWYQFDWGDGAATPRQAAATATHTYATAGTFTVTATVGDSAGLFAATTRDVTASSTNLVGNPGFETGTAGWRAGGGATLSRSSAAHSGSFSAGLSRSASSGRALLADSPPWNTNTVAGSTCTVSAWMMAPAGGKLTARAVELAGTTTVSSYVTHAGSTGSWQQVTVTAPIVSGGDALTIAFFAPLVVGQFLLVDDISETCG